MNGIEQFHTWLGRLVKPCGPTILGVVDKDEDGDPLRATIQLFTKSHCYQIIAVDRGESRLGYLGAQVKTRTPEPGSDYAGFDLTEGSLSVETWQQILEDIVCCELQALSPSAMIYPNPIKFHPRLSQLIAQEHVQ